jgi:hypothetical protein
MAIASVLARASNAGINPCNNTSSKAPPLPTPSPPTPRRLAARITVEISTAPEISASSGSVPAHRAVASPNRTSTS